jgi:hypothetical protein
MICHIDKKLPFLALLIAVCLFFFFSFSFAQTDGTKPLTMVIPEESINLVAANLLPYAIPMGNNFSGALWVQAIDNIKIGKNKINFFLKILGKDIEFSTKIGNQPINLQLGEANVSGNCEASFRYDKEKKLLFITPRIRDMGSGKSSAQATEVLMPLIEGLSGIEYPVEIQKLEPIKTELQNKALKIHFDISNIYSENNKLFVEIIPSVETKPIKKAKR